MQFVVKITVEKQDEDLTGAPQSDVKSALIEELEGAGFEFEVDNSEGVASAPVIEYITDSSRANAGERPTSRGTPRGRRETPSRITE